eukprot:5101776-Amphidinium_carterae.1
MGCHWCQIWGMTTWDGLPMVSELGVTTQCTRVDWSPETGVLRFIVFGGFRIRWGIHQGLSG